MNNHPRPAAHIHAHPCTHHTTHTIPHPLTPTYTHPRTSTHIHLRPPTQRHALPALQDGFGREYKKEWKASFQKHLERYDTDSISYLDLARFHPGPKCAMNGTKLVHFVSGLHHGNSHFLCLVGKVVVRGSQGSQL
jgi:hypothetical protein